MLHHRGCRGSEKLCDNVWEDTTTSISQIRDVQGRKLLLVLVVMVLFSTETWADGSQLVPGSVGVIACPSSFEVSIFREFPLQRTPLDSTARVIHTRPIPCDIEHDLVIDPNKLQTFLAA